MAELDHAGAGVTDPRSEPVRLPPRALLVEFAGLPGAGKTALSHAVAGRLRERGIPVTELRALYPDTSSGARIRKMAWALRGILRRPGDAYRGARAVWASGQRSLVDALKVLHNLLFVSALMWGSGSRERVLLLDQGIVQALWSIGYSARDGAFAGIVEGLRARLPRPDLVVIVEASPHTAAHRLATRPSGGSRLERQAAGDPRPFARAVSRWEELKGIFPQIFGPVVPSISLVDNGDDGVDANAAWLSETIAWLSENIAQIYEHRRTPPPELGGRSGVEMVG